MKMKRALSWIVCLALFFPNLIAYASTKTEKEAGVTIISTTPEDGSTGITPMGTKMEVTFNMPMDANSLSKTTISSVPNAINAVVPDPKSPARCTIYFSALELGTEYTIMFSKQIKAASGERLPKTEISFTTSKEYPKHHQIVNGDMEDKTHLNMFDLAGASSSAVAYVDEGENSVLKFNPQWAGAPIGQNVYIEPGKTYELRAKIKSTTSQIVRMIMSYVSVSEGESNWWHPIVSKTLSPDEWVEFSGTVTIPADLSYDAVRQMRITAANKNEVIYIDDMQFFETGYDVPMPKISAAEESKTETYVSSDVDKALELMVGLGIFEEEILEKKNSYVSRIEAAEAFGKFMNVPFAGSKEIKFTDLAGVKNSGIINFLVEMGIMDGYGEHFYPDNSISYDEVIKAVLNILGYNVAAKEQGYAYTAGMLKLNKGVSVASGAVTYSDFAKIIENATEANIIVNDSNGNFVISERKGLNALLKAEKGKGIISATEYSDLYGASNAGKGLVIIDGEEYRVTCDTFGWEGRLVEYYYKIENGEKIIIHIEGLYSLNSSITIDYKDIIGYSSNKYAYYAENDKQKTVEVAADKKFIYNGKALSSYTAEDMKPKYGTVQLIDNNNDSLYDIVRVEDLETYVVHAVNYIDYKIYDEYEAKKSLSLENSNIIIVEENGGTTTFGNITIGSVVSAAVSKDGKVARLYLSKNSEEGSIGLVAGEKSEIEMSIYDEIHKEGVSKSFKLHPFYKGTQKAREDASDFIAENVVVLIDYRGCAVSVDFKNGTTNWKWAYLIKAVDLYEDFYENDVMFKVFLEGGEHLICYSAPIVRVNGSPKEGEEIKKALNNGAAQMLRIKFNSRDEVCEVVTAGSEDINMKKFTGANYTYSSALSTLGYKVVLESKSIPVFSIPSSVADAEDYQFVYSTASSYLINEKEYNFDAFSIDDNDLNVECVVLKDREVRNPDSWNIGVITDIIQEADEDNEVYEKLSIQNSGSKYTAKVYKERVDIGNLSGVSSGTGLKAGIGDIVMYQNDSQGIVNNMKLIYTAGGTLYSSSNPSSSSNSAHRIAAGKVTLNKNGYIQLLPHGADENNVENYEVINSVNYSKIICVDNDAQRGRVSVVSATEIYDQTCDVDGVDIVVISAWGAATLMVIYT